MGAIEEEPGPWTEPIAVVGLGCKFAGEARNPEGFWQLLAKGGSAWSPIPEDRFSAQAFYHADSEKNGMMNAAGGYFVADDLAHFDAAFFSVSGETAAALDPQFRHQLEVVYEAIENAGISLAQLAGSRTSVFGGITFQDYKDNLIRDGDNLPRNYAIGTGAAFAANRISHFFDLRGPSMTIDTGCSTTLVALHQAVHSLRRRESDLAIVNGSNLMFNPDTFNSMSSASFLSKDGKSYSFDHRAGGYGRGDGVASIVVKRLSDALIDGDPVRAIVRETALNQDGKTESITSPSQAAQAALIHECYKKAKLDPYDTHYFEAHGTGTEKGDLIEAGAMATVFKHRKSLKRPLLLGSVKTNIGHAETTSGLASMIKVILSMENGIIPASGNFEELNPNIPFDDWHLKLVTTPTEWPAHGGRPKRASINNFGYGGSNAHVIVEGAESFKLEDAGRLTLRSHDRSMGLLILSAKSEQSCKTMVTNLKQYLEPRRGTVASRKLLESLVYTLGQRRTLFPWVAAQPVPLNSGIESVENALSTTQFGPKRTSRQPRLGFAFTGQGAQWHAMGRELLAAYPSFLATLETADVYLKELGAQWSLIMELRRDAEQSHVNDTSMSIPICVALQIALVELLRTWGITPSAVTSHSSGEIAAAFTVGALDLRSAMAVAFHRAELTARHNASRSVRGGMIAVGLGVEQMTEYLSCLRGGGKAVVACINSPSSVTVAGDVSAVEEIEAMMKAECVFARRLRVNAAYHSHHMDPIAEPYHSSLMKEQLSGPKKGRLDLIAHSSPVTGDRTCLAEQLADPEHWVASMIQPVHFVEAFIDMVRGGCHAPDSNIDSIIEIGPHTALGSAMKDILSLEMFNGLQLPYNGSLVRNTDAVQSMQALAASLLCRGQQLDVGAVNYPEDVPPHVSVLTDLPSYPWVHETRHWQESRLNRAFRSRKQCPHDLLGPVAAWSNPAAPTWRKIIHLNDNAWLRDHTIHGHVTYPWAALICLGIQSVVQLWSSNGETTPILGFRLHEVDFETPLVIPESADSIELQTILSPSEARMIAFNDWKKFEVSSVAVDGTWQQHARGMISAEYHTLPIETTKPLAGHTRLCESNEFYADLRRIGIDYGPVFQNIKSVSCSWDRKESTSEVDIAGARQDGSWPVDCVLPPVILDSILQAANTALPRTGARFDKSMIPRSIQSLWVSNQTSAYREDRFQVRSSIIRADMQTFQTNVTAVNEHDATPFVQIQHLSFQSHGQGSFYTPSTTSWESDICSRLEWVPETAGTNSNALRSMKQELRHTISPEEVRVMEDLRRVCVYFAMDLIKEIASSALSQLDKTSQKYYGWLHDQVKLAEAGKLGPESATWTQDDTAEQARHMEAVRNASVNGEMVCHLGPHLASMLRGKQPPLDLMMQNDLLTKYYRNNLKSNRSSADAAVILRGILQQNPQARILEIGGGTGGGTQAMLSVIGSHEDGGPLASSYHYTNVSSGFLEAASAEFAQWEDLMQYSKLDIEQDPVAQGFECDSYDVVIACQVLHSTKSIRRTMSNVRKLLKPEGKLLLVETTRDQLDGQFVFGLLPGWWLSEDEERQSSPIVSVALWDEVMKETGFTGNDLAISDCEDEALSATSVILSTARAPCEAVLPSADDFVIVTSRRNVPVDSWLASLQHMLRQGASDIAVTPIYSLETADRLVYDGKICIFVGEAGVCPLLYTLDMDGLEGIQAMATACRGLLWITRGGSEGCTQPEQGLAAGFLRSLRNEYMGKMFVHVDIDPSSPTWSESSIAAISQVLNANFSGAECLPVTESQPCDFEYAERNGTLLVPRLFKDAVRNEAISKTASSDSVEETKWEAAPLQQPDRPLSLRVRTPGMLDTIAFDDDSPLQITDGSIANDMVKIYPKAYGVNLRDVMAAMGQLQEDVMGLECSGIITEIGIDAAAQGLAVGDAVMCLLDGSFASNVYVPSSQVVPMPDDLSFEEAASIPLVFTTAYYSLLDTARLQKGQSILIHAAAGGMGQAAIMLAQHIGATIFVTVGSIAKKQLLMDNYGIAADHIFNSRDKSFVQDVVTATGGRGVDVVLNSLAGPLLQASFDVLAPFGHFIEIGKSDLERNSSLAMQTFARHVSFSSVDSLAMVRHRSDDIHHILQQVSCLAAQKIVRPIAPIKIYPISEAPKAFRLLQSGKQMGKVILSVRQQAIVPTVPRSPKVRLSPNASYLIVGGVQGVGQSVALWMMRHGAKNIIVLSRSAGTVEATRAITEEAQQAGCRVKGISCDISNASALSAALEECRSGGLPPVRGIVQGAMVLEDAILEHMTLQNYQAVIRPKVNGSWNLHNAFPKKEDLDFFLLLSSVTAITGNASETNYAAAGAYQDALATWRHKQGLPCVSIDLGNVKSVGYVHRTAGVRERMAKLGHAWLDEDTVEGILDSAVLDPSRPQIIAGIDAGPGSHWDGDGSSQLSRDARFAALRYRQPRQQAGNTTSAEAEGDSLAVRLAASTSTAEAVKMMLATITQKLADIFMLSPDDIDTTRSPVDYGVDSLVAVELRTMLTRKAGSELSNVAIMQSESIDALAKEATAKSRYVTLAAK